MKSCMSTRPRKSYIGLPANHSCLVIFDRFKAQCTPTVLQALKENHILVALVPANCTDRLQLLDISVNKSIKQFLRGEFHDWYANQICGHLQTSKNMQLVDLRLTIVKPLSATWIIRLMDHFRLHPEFAINGFRRARLF